MPYEAWTGNAPAVSHLRVLGALVTAKAKKRHSSADTHTAHGVPLPGRNCGVLLWLWTSATGFFPLD